MSEMFFAVFDLLGAHLSPRDACAMSQVSKRARDAVCVLAEEIFSRHEYVALIKASYVSDVSGRPCVHCTHFNPRGEKSLMLIPLPHGLSSVGMLRATLEYVSYWRHSAVCVHVRLLQPCHGVSTAWLFATNSYISQKWW
jgi:hypothetical protein